MQRKSQTGLMVGLIAGTLAFLAVIQVRSQAEVARSLETQDNASLAFLIDQLHDANDQLAAQARTLEDRRNTLNHDHSSTVPALADEAQHLRVMEGLAAAAGPGVVIKADAPFNALDLQDALNNLRSGGAEAIMVNNRRVVAASVITQSGNHLLIDGAGVSSPWTVEAIGDPATLRADAEAMTSSLRADPRVRSVNYQAMPKLTIAAVIKPRPFVYASS